MYNKLFNYIKVGKVGVGKVRADTLGKVGTPIGTHGKVTTINCIFI